MSKSFLSPIVVGLLLVITSVGILVYRLTLHPLAKYPGPLLSKLTEWNEFFAVRTGDHHIWLQQLHEKYGPVVRVAPTRLSFNTIGALRSIYGDRKGNLRKHGFTEMISTLQGGARNLQTINDRAAYQVRRRLISHAFSEEALRSSEKYIIERVRNWCDIFRSKAKNSNSWSEDIDMKVWAGCLTEDILGELCFGSSFGACDAGNSDSGDLAVEGAKQAQQLCWMPLPDATYSLLARLVKYGKKQRWEALLPQIKYDEMIQGMLDKRLAPDTAERKDFLHYILQAKDEETGEIIRPDTIRSEAGVLFGAGIDTSATCIAGCLFYLTRYPKVLAKVTTEVRAAFDDIERITHSPQLNTLLYLRACIDETLRISPPVPGPLHRQITSGGIDIDGKVVPSGVEVFVAAYAIHHNEGYFPDSWIFKPERWLAESLEASRDAFCPFTLGPRVCPGRQLAYLDMTIALARLLFLFDVRKSPTELTTVNTGGGVEYELKDWFITQRRGPLVQLKARK